MGYHRKGQPVLQHLLAHSKVEIGVGLFLSLSEDLGADCIGIKLETGGLRSLEGIYPVCLVIESPGI